MTNLAILSERRKLRSSSWSPGQDAALRRIHEWRSSIGPKNQVFTLHGPAGSGTTRVALEMRELDERVAFAAFTGKAAAVLVQNGAPANRTSTLHRLMYHTTINEVTGEYVRHRKQRSELAHISLIVVDETSMINDDLARDLISFQRPILAIGDPYQLGPVSGEADAYFTRGEADMMLTEIHRQAADSLILRVAHQIRNGVAMGKLSEGDEVQFTNACGNPESTPVVVGLRNTRARLNKRMRRELGFTSAMPEVGETLVCEKNDYGVEAFNGTTWVVRSTFYDPERDAVHLELTPTGLPDAPSIAVAVPTVCFTGDVPKRAPRKMQLFSFGYALTCHKAQGSEWPSVCVVDESRFFRDLWRRWFYTSVTRARERLVIASRV